VLVAHVDVGRHVAALEDDALPVRNTSRVHCTVGKEHSLALTSAGAALTVKRSAVRSAFHLPAGIRKPHFGSQMVAFVWTGKRTEVADVREVEVSCGCGTECFRLDRRKWQGRLEFRDSAMRSQSTSVRRSSTIAR
jgi:hypothetical protein